MGVVFNALEENGLAENTLVICTTDHGLAFPTNEMPSERSRYRRNADCPRSRRFWRWASCGRVG